MLITAFFDLLLINFIYLLALLPSENCYPRGQEHWENHTLAPTAGKEVY